MSTSPIETRRFEGIASANAAFLPYIPFLFDIPVIGYWLFVWTDASQADMHIPALVGTAVYIGSSFFTFFILKRRGSGQSWMEISNTGIEGRIRARFRLAWSETLSATCCPAALQAAAAIDLIDTPWTVTLTDRQDNTLNLSDTLFENGAAPGFALMSALRAKGFVDA